jgi:hypothetical protein
VLVLCMRHRTGFVVGVSCAVFLSRNLVIQFRTRVKGRGAPAEYLVVFCRNFYCSQTQRGMEESGCEK